MVLDSRKSLAEKSIHDPNREHEELLVRGLPYITTINDQTILLRDGDVMGSFAVDGISASTGDEVEIAEIADAFSSLVAQQMPDVGFYVHRISSRTAPVLKPVNEKSPFASAADKQWQQFLGAAGLRHRTTLVTITIRPSKAGGLWAKLSGSTDQNRQQLQKRVVRLNQIVTSILETLVKTSPRRMTVSGGEWLGLLATTLSGEFRPIKPARSFIPLNDLITNAPVFFHGDGFTVFGSHSNNTRHGAIITLKDYPSATFAVMCYS